MKIPKYLMQLSTIVFKDSNEHTKFLDHLEKNQFNSARILAEDELDSVEDDIQDFVYSKTKCPQWLKEDLVNAQGLYDLIMLEMEKVYE